MERVNKDLLLSQLELVQPGLSTREVIEQSSCYIFRDGLVSTYNDEIACTHKSCISIQGAVQAQPLLSLLRQLKEEDVEVGVTEKGFMIKGKRKVAYIKMEQDILLPVDTVDRPEKWRAVAEEMSEAIKLVQQCVSKNEEYFALTCIHLHPTWIEACDSLQVARSTFKTGLKKPILVKRDSLKWVSELDMQKFSETENWLHFKNSSGLILSCRRWEDEFPDMTTVLKSTGTALSLPKGLAEAAKKAAIFTSDTQETNQILIKLSPGKMRLEGTGVAGKYIEQAVVKYAGKSIAFLISPDLLQEITKKHSSCEVTTDHLIITGTNFKYVSCVGAVD